MEMSADELRGTEWWRATDADLLAAMADAEELHRRAYATTLAIHAEARARNVLRPSHGRGWYVAADERKDWPNSLESFSETAARIGLTATSVVLRADTAMATLDEAETVGVAPGAPLFHLERVRMLRPTGTASASPARPRCCSPATTSS
jgi:hypothetical protein